MGTVLGLASGILGLGFAATVATRWFVEKRGLVLGILAASWAAGQIMLVPFIAWIVLTLTGNTALFRRNRCWCMFTTLHFFWEELAIRSWSDAIWS